MVEVHMYMSPTKPSSRFQEFIDQFGVTFGAKSAKQAAGQSRSVRMRPAVLTIRLEELSADLNSTVGPCDGHFCLSLQRWCQHTLSTAGRVLRLRAKWHAAIRAKCAPRMRRGATYSF